MVIPLLLSTLASGIIATSIMLFFLYQPQLWGGSYYDVRAALGSAFTGRDDDRSRFLGILIYYLGGLVFAFFYGWIVLAFMTGDFLLPDLRLYRGLPVEINLFYPLLGVMLGFIHGLLVGFLLTIVIVEHHPITAYRTRVVLIPANLLGHIAFGATVTFFHHQFLQLLVGTGMAG